MGSGSPRPLEPAIHRQQQQFILNPASYLQLLQQNVPGGNLGVPQSALQMQGADAIGSLLRTGAPEQRAFDIALPQLQQMLTGTGPQFERDLALANQQGGRFGSSNAILRGEALRNLYTLRNQTAGTLGLLGAQAGQGGRAQAQQAFDVGQQQAGQADIETQRRLQVLLQLLGAGQQVGFQYQQGGGGLGGILGGVGGLALGSLLGPLGGAAGAALGSSLFGQQAPGYTST